MDFKKKTRYACLLEGYSPGGTMSIYGALKGLPRRLDPEVRCWCAKPTDPRVKLPPEGADYPTQLCADCRATIFGSKN